MTPVPFIPHGYSTLPDARGRALRLWGVEGEHRLISNLSNGAPPTFYVNRQNQVLPLEPEFWLKVKDPVKVISTEDTGIVVSQLTTVGLPYCVGRPLIKSADLDVFLPAVYDGMIANEKAIAEAHVPAKKSTAGRKSHPEADLFWMEICRILLDGDVRSLGALTERMNDWASKDDGRYDAETIRKKCGVLFKSLGWSDGAIPD